MGLNLAQAAPPKPNHQPEERGRRPQRARPPRRGLTTAGGADDARPRLTRGGAGVGGGLARVGRGSLGRGVRRRPRPGPRRAPRRRLEEAEIQRLKGVGAGTRVGGLGGVGQRPYVDRLEGIGSRARVGDLSGVRLKTKVQRLGVGARARVRPREAGVGHRNARVWAAIGGDRHALMARAALLGGAGVAVVAVGVHPGSPRSPGASSGCPSRGRPYKDCCPRSRRGPGSTAARPGARRRWRHNYRPYRTGRRCTRSRSCSSSAIVVLAHCPRGPHTGWLQGLAVAQSAATAQQPWIRGVLALVLCCWRYLRCNCSRRCSRRRCGNSWRQRSGCRSRPSNYRRCRRCRCRSRRARCSSRGCDRARRRHRCNYRRWKYCRRCSRPGPCSSRLRGASRCRRARSTDPGYTNPRRRSRSRGYSSQRPGRGRRRRGYRTRWCMNRRRCSRRRWCSRRRCARGRKPR